MRMCTTWECVPLTAQSIYGITGCFDCIITFVDYNPHQWDCVVCVSTEQKRQTYVAFASYSAKCCVCTSNFVFLIFTFIFFCTYIQYSNCPAIQIHVITPRIYPYVMYLNTNTEAITLQLLYVRGCVIDPHSSPSTPTPPHHTLSLPSKPLRLKRDSCFS